MSFCFGIILVNYNNVPDTTECINSLLESNYKNFKIFVVDNSEDESSIDQIKNKIKNECLFIKTKNNGFAAANNVVLSEDNKDIDFYWILNNDTSIPDTFLFNLNEKLLSKKNKIYSQIYSNTLLYYKTNTIQAIGGKINKLTGLPKHCNNNEEFNFSNNYPKDYDYPIGASIIIHKEVLEKIGLMNEDYFLYYEELDWMEKAKKQNITLEIFSDLYIYHKEGNSIGNKKDKYNFKQLYYSNRSRLLWMKKYHKKFYFFGQLISFLIYLKNFRIFKGKENTVFLKSIFSQKQIHR